MSYSAVVLDDDSHNKLVERFKGLYPNDWEIISHHLTINMGKINPNYKKYLGKVFDLEVISFAKDNLVAAVGVRGFPTTNNVPHITLAVNRKDGGKPYLSNKLNDWTTLSNTFKVSGIVKEI